MNIFKMEVKNSQLARFGVVCYITQLVLLIAGVMFTNVFNVLDILVLGLFLYFARKAAKSDGNITVHFYLYFVYWLLSLLSTLLSSYSIAYKAIRLLFSLSCFNVPFSFNPW